MSSSQSASATPSLPRPYVVNLIQILREANQRYSQLAASVRNSLRPTHHARKRAIALNLSVNVKNARKLDQRHVSSIPLPILESPASPLAPERYLPVVCIRPPVPAPAPGHHAQIAAPIPVRAAPPRPAHSIGMAVVGCEREIKRLSRPASVEARPSRHLLDLISAVSITVGSPDSAISGSRSESNEKSRFSWSSLSSGDDSSDEERVRCAVVFSSVTTQGEPEMDAKDTGNSRRLNVPIDVSRPSWSSDLSYGYGSDVGSSSSGSSNSSVSHGLATPVTESEGNSPMPKPMIRIKRKSSTSFVGTDDEIFHEKRPKYERKNWNRPVRR